VTLTVVVSVDGCCQGTLDSRDDLGERDLLGGAGEHVAAADAALGPNDAGSLDLEQDLLEIRLGEGGPFGDLLHGRGAIGLVEGEREEGPGGVVAAGRHLHGVMVARGRT